MLYEYLSHINEVVKHYKPTSNSLAHFVSINGELMSHFTKYGFDNVAANKKFANKIRNMKIGGADDADIDIGTIEANIDTLVNMLNTEAISGSSSGMCHDDGPDGHKVGERIDEIRTELYDIAKAMGAYKNQTTGTTHLTQSALAVQYINKIITDLNQSGGGLDGALHGLQRGGHRLTGEQRRLLRDMRGKKTTFGGSIFSTLELAALINVNDALDELEGQRETAIQHRNAAVAERDAAVAALATAEAARDAAVAARDAAYRSFNAANSMLTSTERGRVDALAASAAAAAQAAAANAARIAAEQRLQDAQRDLSDTSTMLATVQSQVGQLTADLAAANGTLAAERAQVIQLTADLAAANGTLTAERAQVGQLTADLAATNATLAAEQTRVGQLTAQKAADTQTIAQLQAQKAAERAQVVQLDAENNSLLRGLADRGHDLYIVETRRNALEQEKTTLEQEKTALGERLLALQSAPTVDPKVEQLLKKRIKLQGDKIADLKKQIETYDAKIEEYGDIIDDHNKTTTTLKTLKTTADNLKNTVVKLNKLILFEKTNNAHNIDIIKTNIAHIQALIKKCDELKAHTQSVPVAANDQTKKVIELLLSYITTLHSLVKDSNLGNLLDQVRTMKHLLDNHVPV